jgi:hypothetical protein
LAEKNQRDLQIQREQAERHVSSIFFTFLFICERVVSAHTLASYNVCTKYISLYSLMPIKKLSLWFVFPVHAHVSDNCPTSSFPIELCFCLKFLSYNSINPEQSLYTLGFFLKRNISSTLLLVIIYSLHPQMTDLFDQFTQIKKNV